MAKVCAFKFDREGVFRVRKPRKSARGIPCDKVGICEICRRDRMFESAGSFVEKIEKRFYGNVLMYRFGSEVVDYEIIRAREGVPGFSPEKGSER